MTLARHPNLSFLNRRVGGLYLVHGVAETSRGHQCTPRGAGEGHAWLVWTACARGLVPAQRPSYLQPIEDSGAPLSAAGPQRDRQQFGSDPSRCVSPGASRQREAPCRSVRGPSGGLPWCHVGQSSHFPVCFSSKMFAVLPFTFKSVPPVCLELFLKYDVICSRDPRTLFFIWIPN